MMSYKQFMRELRDDVEPDDAKVMYERYKSEYFMTHMSEYFRTVKDQQSLREKYHPGVVVAAIERRSELAAKAAAAVAQEFQEGRLAPDLVGDGAGGAPSEGDMNVDGSAGARPARRLVPASSWSDERVSRDLAQARQLVAALDAEKGIGFNPVQAAAAGGDQAMAGDAAAIGMLDLLLEWLWRVHRLDYYGGSEALDALEAPAGVRTVRPPRPHLEKSAGDAAVLGASFFDSLDSMWESRCRKGDPLRAMLQGERVERDMEEEIDRKITMVTDKEHNEYWRCKICSKMFKGKDFVVKHVRNKHEAEMDDMRAGVLEKVYEDNFVRCEKVPEGAGAQQQQPAAGGQGMPFGAPMGMPFAPMGMQPMMMGPGGFPMFPQLAQNFQQGGGRRGGGGKRGGAGNAAAKAAQAKAKEISQSEEGPKEAQGDPRKLNQYKDLDSASADVPVLDYRSLLL